MANEKAGHGKKEPHKSSEHAAPARGRPARSPSATRPGPLLVFRKAVLSNRALQDRLRDTGTCGELAQIANEYLKSNVKIVVSGELEGGPVRQTAQTVFEELFHVTEGDIAAYLESNSNEKGEFLLGKSELAMVAGGSEVSSTNTCSYGSGCGSCGCSSTVVCVCS
jgi:hypothetical protein